MYLPIQPERLYERIVNQIEGCIVAGESKAGDLLPSENELAKQLTVSRTAASEAIKALREKPLVEVRPGRGAFITNRMPDAMRHSPGSLMKFGSVNGFSNVVEVGEAVEIMDTALDSMDVFVEADLDFHLALAEATQNPIVPILGDSVIDLLRKHRKEKVKLSIRVGGDCEAFEKVSEYAEAANAMVAAVRG